MTRTARPALFILSALCYTAWLVPVDGESQAQDFQLAAGIVPSMPAAGRMPEIVIHRDPFAGEPRADASPEETGDAVADDPAAARESHAVGDVVRAPAGPGSFDFAEAPERVPDIGDSEGAASTAESAERIVLRATIVGRRAVAYVERGSLLSIVRVGDRLDRRTIARIEVDGIVFDDGSRLDLIGDHPAPPPAAMSARPVTLDELRRALAPFARTPRPAVSLAPEPAPFRQDTAYPTPGPLPTVDSNGHDPSFVPTSDPRRPTPYPVPGIDR